MSGDKERERIGKWLRLHLTEQVGPRTFRKLRDCFGDVDRILGATAGELAAVKGIGPKKAEQICGAQKQIKVEEEMERAEELGVQIITLECEGYPALLKQIHTPPTVIFVKGELQRRDELAVAIVGSRRCSHYGREQAARLSHLLAAAGFTVVSGLARGIDSEAHRGALAAEGRTIAVLGCGLAEVYPPENVGLAERIGQNGALVSELPMGFAPLAGMFHARNRIISGLSLGTIVVEASKNSGALITANYAVEQNREVLAVAGRVDAPGSWGPHKLIKDGAVLVEKIEDVLEALGQVGSILSQHAKATSAKAEKSAEPGLFDFERLQLNEKERIIYNCLDHEARHIDDIITSSKLPMNEVYAAVTSLQLKGIIKQLAGSYYQKRNK